MSDHGGAEVILTRIKLSVMYFTEFPLNFQ